MGKVVDRNLLVHREGTNESQIIEEGQPFPPGTPKEVIDKFGIDERKLAAGTGGTTPAADDE